MLSTHFWLDCVRNVTLWAGVELCLSGQERERGRSGLRSSDGQDARRQLGQTAAGGCLVLLRR